MKKFLFIGSSLLFLTMFLSACGANSSTISSTPPKISTTATINQPATATPLTQTTPATATPLTQTTPATSNTNTSNGNATSCTATYGCGVGSSQLTPYTGNGYKLDYPGSWVIQSDNSKGAIFAAPDNSASFHVFVQDASSQTNPLQYEFGTLAADNCKPVTNGKQTVQNNGLTWQQSQFVCAPGNIGGKQEQISILISTNTYNNTAYSIDYMSNPDTFATVYQTFFLPMVTSFTLQ